MPDGEVLAYPCPFCGAPANLTDGCAGCGREPDAQAAAVVEMDGRLRALAAEADAAHRAYLAARARVDELAVERNTLAHAVKQRVLAAAGSAPVAGSAPAGPAGVAASAPAGTPAVPAGETSTRTVQNVLFVVGGLLLGAAAVVFTVVAWSNVGLAGRAAILAAVTALTLAVPVLARRRGLRATAETFAALGLLLVALDGYAAWFVNLAGVADRVVPTGYAAIVFAAVAVVAVGYALLTGLTAARLTALVAAQPVVPLALVDGEPPAYLWSLALSALAAANLAVGWRAGRAAGLAVRVCAFTLGGLVLLGALVVGGVALLVVDGPAAVARVAVAVTAIGAVLYGGLRPAGGPARSLGEAFWAVLTVAGAARLVASAWPTEAELLVPAVVLGAALLALPLPAGFRHGVGAFTALAGVAYLAATLTVATATVGRAQPTWRAAPELTVPDGTGLDWRLPAALVLIGVALALLTSGAARAVTIPVTVASVALAGPVAVSLPWWTPSILDLMVAVVAVLLAARWRGVAGHVAGAVALLLALHAILVGLGHPAATAATTAVLLLIAGLVTRLTDAGRMLGAVAVAVATMAAPAFGAAVGRLIGDAVGAGQVTWTASGAVAGLAVVVAATGAVRTIPRYAVATAWTLAVVGPFVALAAVAADARPYPVYPMAVALLLVAALRWYAVDDRRCRRPLAAGAVTAALILLVAQIAGASSPLPAPWLVVPAAVLLAVSARPRPERWLLEAAAHLTVVAAVLAAAPALRQVAVVFLLWGVALGLRALAPGRSGRWAVLFGEPGEPGDPGRPVAVPDEPGGPAAVPGKLGRWPWLAGAAGCLVAAWWSLLAAEGVGWLEAYTVPAAAVALAVGWYASRRRPHLHSWAVYGPALVAAFAPSLAVVVTGAGDPWRRLLLGVAALVVTVLGATTRRQAPTVVGSVVLVVVALRELIAVWDLLPRWIPLAVGGSLLVGLAITYERRRRDVRRLRAAVGRMR